MSLEGTKLIQRVHLVWMNKLVGWLYSLIPMKFFLEGSVMAHISLTVQDKNGICTQVELQVVVVDYGLTMWSVVDYGLTMCSVQYIDLCSQTVCLVM